MTRGDTPMLKYGVKYPLQYTHMSHRRSQIHGPHKTTSMGHIHGPHKTTLTDPGLAGLFSLSPLSPPSVWSQAVHSLQLGGGVYFLCTPGFFIVGWVRA